MVCSRFKFKYPITLFSTMIALFCSLYKSIFQTLFVIYKDQSNNNNSNKIFMLSTLLDNIRTGNMWYGYYHIFPVRSTSFTTFAFQCVFFFQEKERKRGGNAHIYISK